MNNSLVLQTLNEAIRAGAQAFCICPGSRNRPFVAALKQNPHLQSYYWFEERSAAFFALGRSKLTRRPVAVITTSGTAAAELLPAAMEAYYSSIPLILITADRPRRYRGSGAPQSAEQVGLYGQYTRFSQDLANQELCDLSRWDRQGPAHLNVCFEEPLNDVFEHALAAPSELRFNQDLDASKSDSRRQVNQFLEEVSHPFIVVGALPFRAKDSVVDFLLKLNAPVFLEGISGLREDARLAHLRISRSEKLWEKLSKASYPVDGVLRIGGVPTFRFWRDLENKQGQIKVCSISPYPFSGLSWGGVHCFPHVYFESFFKDFDPLKCFESSKSQAWIEQDRIYQEHLQTLLQEEPQSEPSLFRWLSQKIPENSLLYLGNSLPIREWDLAACGQDRNLAVYASRGVNGIDGQISTFLGLCRKEKGNWAILGDLTALYDLAGPWILSQLQSVKINLVIINNGGGKIFARMSSQQEFQNRHTLGFEPFARLWRVDYEKWHSIPAEAASKHSRIIEIAPNEESTNRFWKKLEGL